MQVRHLNVQKYLANLRLQVPINLQRLKLLKKLVAIKVLIHANAVRPHHKQDVVVNADKIKDAYRTSVRVFFLFLTNIHLIIY